MYRKTPQYWINNRANLVDFYPPKSIKNPAQRLTMKAVSLKIELKRASS